MPALPLQRVRCHTCQCDTLHDLRYRTGFPEDDEEFLEDEQEKYFDVLQCRGCQELVLRRTCRYVAEPGGPCVEDIRYFPPARSRDAPKWRHKIPEKLQELLLEIYRSLDAQNVTLPLIGARTLLDMVMLEKIGDIGGFKAKLKKLEEGGYVSAQNREILEAALDMGNAAAHRGHSASVSEVHSVMDIVENMLQALYVFPEVAKSLKDATPPRVHTKTSAG